jgi:hypothetical protein
MLASFSFKDHETFAKPLRTLSQDLDKERSSLAE